MSLCGATRVFSHRGWRRGGVQDLRFAISRTPPMPRSPLLSHATLSCLGDAFCRKTHIRPRATKVADRRCLPWSLSLPVYIARSFYEYLLKAYHNDSESTACEYERVHVDSVHFWRARMPVFLLSSIKK